jgi:hypothetical protein
MDRDWSSDVCSSDLHQCGFRKSKRRRHRGKQGSLEKTPAHHSATMDPLVNPSKKHLARGLA